MKKSLALLLSLLLICVTVPMVAAEGMTVTLTSTKSVLTAGETATVTLTLSDAVKARKASVQFYPDSDLELVSGEWLMQGSIMSVFKAEDSNAIITFSSDTDFNGAVLQFVVRAKENITDNSTPCVTAAVELRDATKVIDSAYGSTAFLLTTSPIIPNPDPDPGPEPA